MALLDVSNLVVEFPTRRGVLRALDGISFTIEPGEVLGVVGESGAGKSLMGAAIVGLLEPPGRVASPDCCIAEQLPPPSRRPVCAKMTHYHRNASFGCQ